MQDKIINAKDAAARLGVSDRRVHQFIKTGKLPALKWGNTWIIEDADLRAFEMRRKLAPAAPGPAPSVVTVRGVTGTLREVAEKLGLSRQRAHAILQKERRG